jgi:excisionase family DNA binding protein
MPDAQLNEITTRAYPTAFEELLDSVEAAALLKIHPKTLQRMARNHELQAVRIGKLWRFRVSHLNQWLARQGQRAA